jgi:hypothetical protein
MIQTQRNAARKRSTRIMTALHLNPVRNLSAGRLKALGFVYQAYASGAAPPGPVQI